MEESPFTVIISQSKILHLPFSSDSAGLGAHRIIAAPLLSANGASHPR